MATLIVASVLAASVSANNNLFSENADIQSLQFNEFKQTFGKRYATVVEEANRFKTFIENVKNVDMRNMIERQANGTAVHGITKFADLTADEFKAFLNVPGDKPMLGSEHHDHVSTVAVDTTATLVDWTGKYTTPVRNQGYCGSCWAFSASEQLESDAIRVLGQTFVLSEQQVVSCDKSDGGCNGGWPYSAWNYVKGAGGQALESQYPYTSGAAGVTGTCKDNGSRAVTVNGYTKIAKEADMASYVQKTGPLSICVDASNWSSYTGGIMKTCGKSINHAVQMVGVDVSGGYWKIRNSWDTTWGEQGFIRVSYGSNTCGIEYYSAYTNPVKK